MYRYAFANITCFLDFPSLFRQETSKISNKCEVDTTIKLKTAINVGNKPN